MMNACFDMFLSFRISMALGDLVDLGDLGDWWRIVAQASWASCCPGKSLPSSCCKRAWWPTCYAQWPQILWW